MVERDNTELTNNIAEAEEIIADGSDAEMVDMAKMQLEEAKEELPALEEKIRMMLVPKDRRMQRMRWSRYVQEPVEMKPVFLQEIFIRCLPNIAKAKVGA